MAENLKIGQEVWFKSTYDNICSGKIMKFLEVDGVMHVQIKGTRDTIGTMSAKAEGCYLTKQELLNAMQAESDACVKEYCESIRTVEDLVRFCYKYNMCAEKYTDYDAKKAARIRAKELLGIELE